MSHSRLRYAFAPTPIHSFSVPFAIKAAIEAELDELEASGAIEPVMHSDWAAPIVPVPKKNGKFRICGDYKVAINQELDVEQYPLPKPEYLFATLAGGKKFSKLDLSQAYQQLPLDDEKQMDSVLQGIPHVICYLDDILVTGVDDADHRKNLASIFERQHGFRLKHEKCAFMQESVEYLGHKIDAEGLHALPSKVYAIVNAPEPRNIQELRSFLVLLNYYGKFLPNLSSTVHPLHELLQQSKRWKWSTQCAQAFQKVKQVLSSASVLMHYDPTLPLTLAGDASACGIGAVNSHVLPDGTEKPIAFASRSLSTSERIYAQLEKEALSLIIWGYKVSPILVRSKIPVNYRPQAAAGHTRPQERHTLTGSRLVTTMGCATFRLSVRDSLQKRSLAHQRKWIISPTTFK